MRVLVTGGYGFVGAGVARHLSSRGHSVVATYRNSPIQSGRCSSVDYRWCDLTDGSEVRNLLKSSAPDVVVHTAARMAPEGAEHLQSFCRQNVEVQANLLSAMVEAGCAKIIYCSTISVYSGPPLRDSGFREGDPVQPDSGYGWSKHAAEELLRQQSRANGIKGISLRLAGIHGAQRTSGVVFRMFDRAINGLDLYVTEPLSRFNFIFRDDAISAIESAIEYIEKCDYEVFNIAATHSFSLPQLAMRIASICGRGNIVLGDNKVPRNQVMDVELARLRLGFVASPLEERLAQFHSELNCGIPSWCTMEKPQ